MAAEWFLVGGFVFSVLLGIIIIPNILLISYKKRLFDIPDERKIHSVPIPRLGGLSFFPVILITFCLGIGCASSWDFLGEAISWDIIDGFFFLCIGGVLLYLVGEADDLVGVNYRYKFIAQVLAALLLVWSGNWLNSLGGLLGIGELPAVVGIPLTVLAVVLITNAINLIDGIDGLASGLSCIALAVLCVWYAALGDYTYALLAVATLGVVGLFWFYNVFGNANRGRKLFMGDAGSLTLGYILSLLIIRISISAPHDGDGGDSPALMVAFSTLLVPMFDVFRVVLHRLRAGKNPFLPDKNHFHHRLLRTGMRVRIAMVTIICIALFFIGLNAILAGWMNSTWLLVLDVVLWVVMQAAISRAIKKREAKAN